MATSKEKEKEMGGSTTPWVAEWGSSSVPLKEFHTKHDVPNLLKVTKGQYMNIGLNRFALQKTHQQLYLHSVRSGIKVLSHSVQKLPDGVGMGNRKFRLPKSKLIALEQRLSIPISYQGWFEVLSEDGKGSKSIDSVQELAKLFPEKCLVRLDILSYCANDDGKLSTVVTKMIPKGEQLRLSGVITTSFPPSTAKVKLLRCITNKGENVYLPFDKKGIFSSIATPENITGVQQINDIVKKYRMPLTVKLVQGVWPRVDSNRFTGYIRLDWVYVDETAFVCPFEKDQLRMIPIPLNAPLTVCPAANFKSMTERDNYKSILHRCNRMITNYNNTIHLLISIPDIVVKNRSNKMARNVFSVSTKHEASSRPISKKREEKLMNEIDDLYTYVRDGGVAPKSRFSYDSDEESYWEEPAYEPIDDFQQRLKSLEAGELPNTYDNYIPADLTKINLDVNQNMSSSEDSKKQISKLQKNSEDKEIEELIDKKEALRISSGTTKSSEKSSSQSTGSNSRSSDNEDMKKRITSSLPLPPQLPPRRYHRSGSMPILDMNASSVKHMTHTTSEKTLVQSYSPKMINSSQESSNSGSRKKNSHMVYMKTPKTRSVSFIAKKRQTMFL